ncbi:hypothetical protein Tco_1104089 [Tanacetum coccineum]
MNAPDTLVWHNIHGNVKKFSVSQVWDDIRHRESKVNWYSMVWFPSCIPRHAINHLVINRRMLKNAGSCAYVGWYLIPGHRSGGQEAYRTNNSGGEACFAASYIIVMARAELEIIQKRRELSQEINNQSVPTLISQSPGPSRKRSRSPSSPFYLDATTFSDGKPSSETSELNPEEVTARLEDIDVEINTLRADTEDKELLISELQDFLAVTENEISLL